MRIPRYWNIILGIWLFFTAFFWTHTAAQRTNTWVVGLLCAAIATMALVYERARYLNTALAVWLFVSAWALPSATSATVWNNVLVAIAMLVISLLPNRDVAPRDRRSRLMERWRPGEPRPGAADPMQRRRRPEPPRRPPEDRPGAPM